MQKKYSQEEIVKGCLAGNAECNKAFYNLFAGKMMGVCLRYTKNRADAEDMLQDGFINVFTHLHQFRNEGSLEGWVRRVIVTTGLQRLRKKNTLFMSLEIENEMAENGFHSEQDTTSDLEMKDLLNMIRTLPVGYQTVFNLYAIEGYSHKEISEMLNISEGTSKSQLSRARILLQRMIHKASALLTEREKEFFGT